MVALDVVNNWNLGEHAGAVSNKKSWKFAKAYVLDSNGNVVTGKYF